MKNKTLNFLIIFILYNSFFLKASSYEQFNFDVTEVEILENGNIIKGLKRGIVSTSDGVIIHADTFIFNKILNILNAEGDVKIEDIAKDYLIYADKITYLKNKELIITENNSKAIYKNEKIINANSFEYDKIQNILNASGNVEIKDEFKDYKIYANNVTYFRNIEKIITTGITESFIQSRYEILSEDVTFLIDEENLSSNKKTKIKDSDAQIYHLDKFNYQIDQELLKGENILVITNYNLPTSDKIYFSNAIIDLKSKKFIAKDTKIKVHKGVFDNSENDPRLEGISSTGNDDTMIVNKAIFTSCKRNDKCPPWSIKAKKITHDKKKKEIIYDNALLRIYDIPVLYFPKFFHPDPSVKRQSGFLQPEFNDTDILGSSLTIPYFNVISDNKDLTFTPTWFDKDILMAQSEYRQVNKNSEFLADFGLVNGYKSPTTKKKNNLSHIFADYNLKLNLENFSRSDFELSLEKVTNDTYLKVFDQHITKSKLRPNEINRLNNNIKLFLENKNFEFETGVETYEDLQIKKSDRYQYAQYYDFNTVLSEDYLNGSIKFSSSGSNNLKETNNLSSNIINDLNYNSQNFISNLGTKNNFNVYFKNLNSSGKNNVLYKSSPQIELASLFEINMSMPLVKYDSNYTNLITPKISFKFNPSDMKDYSTSSNKINVGNIFTSNRLGFSDSFEAGKSLTLGLDYKKEKGENLEQINKYFELKLATVLRDKEEDFMPTKSTINRKSSNLFGSITNSFSENLNINYNFALDNNYKSFEYNDFGATLSINNFVTEFYFIEENGEMGDSNVLENTISYNFDNSNFISFNTRRNRKLNLTEYYNLVYEYKNDCLTAGVKYKKSYYEDRDLKPSEDLLFTITLFPLTTYEYQAEDLLNK